MPERILTANSGNSDVKATAYIIGQEDNIFDIHYVEHKTTPNPITQTYGVTFAIDGKAANLFYPGSRAMVNIQSNVVKQSTLLIPINALMGDKNEGFTVWRFNSTSSDVHPVKVEVEGFYGEFVSISGGISAGDKVVSAAVNQMRKGLKVKEYKADY